MSSKSWLKILFILTLLFLMVSALPVAAQEPTAEPEGDSTEAAADEATVEPTAEPTEEVTAEPTEEVTAEPTEEVTAEPTEEVTAEPTEETTAQPTEEATEEPTAEPTEEATPEPTEEPTVEPTVQPTMPITDTATITPTVELAPAEDVTASGALPGSFTSQIIAIANLNSSGAAETVGLALDEIGGTGVGNVTSGVVYPGGVSFIRSSDLPSNGEFSGILSSGFPAAAAVLTTNSTAKVADAYPGIATTGTELFGIIIFNKHANFESVLYCQNAGSGNATISAQLYKAGESSPKITLTSNSLVSGEGVKWDIADNTAVQTAWPGGTGQFGYARFTSGNEIACIVDNQRMASPYVQSTFQAVPATGFSGTDLRLPLVFNGHGGSSQNNRGVKWNTGVSILNVNSGQAQVTVIYTAANGYTNTCTTTIGGNQTVSWYTPEAGTSQSIFSCTGGPLAWQYPGPTYGGVRVQSNIPVLALANSNRYDSAAGLGAGYSSVSASPSIATNKVVCPLAFNKNSATDWITGLTAVNVGGGSTNLTFRVVKAGLDPVSNSQTFSRNNVIAGSTGTVALFEEGSAFTNFEGAVFIESSAQPIFAVSSNTNYNTLGAAALYDCINY